MERSFLIVAPWRKTSFATSLKDLNTNMLAVNTYFLPVFISSGFQLPCLKCANQSSATAVE
jgi:hypothetical protein